MDRVASPDRSLRAAPRRRKGRERRPALGSVRNELLDARRSLSILLENVGIQFGRFGKRTEVREGKRAGNFVFDFGFDFRTLRRLDSLRQALNGVVLDPGTSFLRRTIAELVIM